MRMRYERHTVSGINQDRIDLCNGDTVFITDYDVAVDVCLEFLAGTRSHRLALS